MVRIKERYLLVNILYPPEPATTKGSRLPNCVVQHQPTIERLTPQLLLKAINSQVGVLFGDYGQGALGGHLSGKSQRGFAWVFNYSLLINSKVKYLSLATSTFILRCAREHYKMLWAALTLMTQVPVKDGRPCIFRVVRVSGTIRKAEEEAIRQARKLVLSAQENDLKGFLSTGPEEEKRPIREDITMQDATDDSDADMISNDDDDD